MTKLAARLMSQLAEDTIPIGITHELIRKWKNKCDMIECRKARAEKPDLAKRMDKLVEITHVKSFNCHQINKFEERFEQERDINGTHVNIYTYIKFMNGMTFSKCLYDFHARVNEILSRLEDENRTIIERLAEISDISQTSTRVLTALSELEEPRLLNGRSELLPTYLNEITRSLHMQVAIYMSYHINRLYSHDQETPEQHKTFFNEQYYQLIYEPCRIVYDDLSKWLYYVLLTRSIDDSQEVNFKLDHAHRWGQYYSVCTILGIENSQAQEHVYRYFMTHLDARTQLEAPTYFETISRLFHVPISINERDLVLTQFMEEAHLTTDSLTVEPYSTLEDIHRFSNDGRNMNLNIDILQMDRVIGLSHVSRNKCTTESLVDRYRVAQIINNFSVENISRYIAYFNNKQFKLCEEYLYIALSDLLGQIDDKNLVRLEQLKRFVTHFSYIQQQQHQMDLPRIDLQIFNRAAATFFHLYRYPFKTLQSQLVGFNDLLTKTCMPFLGKSDDYPSLITIVKRLESIEELEINTMIVNSMIIKFLIYERTCEVFESMSFSYSEISLYLRESSDMMPSSMREIWRTVSKKRSPFSLNWLKLNRNSNFRY